MRSRRVLRFAIAIATLWFGVLAVLVLSTANPIVLNQRQLRLADVVVEADAEQVYRVWAVRGQPPEASTIDFERPAEATGRVLAPLRRTREGYEVVPVPMSRDEPAVRLVYPATDASRAALQEAIAAAGIPLQ